MATITVFIIILSILIVIPFANAEWTMFRGDLAYSGAGPSNPPLSPALLWKYTTIGYEVYSSPAVLNGVVYIGSDDGNIMH